MNSSYADCQHRGWLSPERAATLARLAGIRTIVVHGYGGVSLEIARISCGTVSPISLRSPPPSGLGWVADIAASTLSYVGYPTDIAGSAVYST